MRLSDIESATAKVQELLAENDRLRALCMAAAEHARDHDLRTRAENKRLRAERDAMQAVLFASLSETERKLIDKHCDWIAFQHAWNAVKKLRMEMITQQTTREGEIVTGLRETKIESRADRFDMDLFKLIATAETYVAERRADAAYWKVVLDCLREARPKVRALMHPTRRSETA